MISYSFRLILLYDKQSADDDEWFGYVMQIKSFCWIRYDQHHALADFLNGDSSVLNSRCVGHLVYFRLKQFNQTIILSFAYDENKI